MPRPARPGAENRIANVCVSRQGILRGQRQRHAARRASAATKVCDSVPFFFTPPRAPAPARPIPPCPAPRAPRSRRSLSPRATPRRVRALRAPCVLFGTHARRCNQPINNKRIPHTEGALEFRCPSEPLPAASLALHPNASAAAPPTPSAPPKTKPPKSFRWLQKRKKRRKSAVAH